MKVSEYNIIEIEEGLSMFVNRSSSSKLTVTSSGTHSKIVPFDRAIATSEPRVESDARVVKNSWVELLRALGDWFLHADEPRIQEKRDRDGQLYFKVYDPLARLHYVFDTENEVRAWLEGRYNS